MGPHGVPLAPHGAVPRPLAYRPPPYHTVHGDLRPRPVEPSKNLRRTFEKPSKVYIDSYEHSCIKMLYKSIKIKIFYKFI